MEPKKTGKRIVSKGEYVGRLSKKAGFSAAGSILVLICLISLLNSFTSALTYASLRTSIIYPGQNTQITAIFGTIAIFFVALSFPCGYVGRRAIRKARQIDTGLPFTRANVAYLPTEETLVRASEEPTPEQQAVLLRAAAQEQETPPEELVRASSGP